LTNLFLSIRHKSTVRNGNLHKIITVLFKMQKFRASVCLMNSSRLTYLPGIQLMRQLVEGAGQLGWKGMLQYLYLEYN
jgi:hypothetical protein